MTQGRRPHIAVVDHGAGNVCSVLRAFEHVGADVSLTADGEELKAADGVVLPGVGAFASVMQALKKGSLLRHLGYRIAGGKPVLGICVGHQVLFTESTEGGTTTAGLDEWPGVVERLKADVVPHMGWNSVTPPEDTQLFRGIEDERFYFVHSYAVQSWDFDVVQPLMKPPMVTWSEHGGPFIAAVENGPLCSVQFHPEKSGDAGAQLIKNWMETL